MNIMKFNKTISLVFVLFVFSNHAWSQPDDRVGFFVEGAEITVQLAAATARDPAVMFVNYVENDCPNCETRLTYNADTIIYGGINSEKMDYYDIASLRAKLASILVDADNYITEIRLFNLPN